MRSSCGGSVFTRTRLVLSAGLLLRGNAPEVAFSVTSPWRGSGWQLTYNPVFKELRGAGVARRYLPVLCSDRRFFAKTQVIPRLAMIFR